MNKTYNIRGMSCNSCKERIEKKLKMKQGIKIVKVNLKSNSLSLEYNPNEVSLSEIKKMIKQLGYELVEKEVSSQKNQKKIWLWIGAAVILFLLVNSIVPDFSTVLTAGNSISLMMLFVIGVTTSFHCVSMCGGIALSQVVGQNNNLKRNIMYNAGRVISYTVIGGVVGAISSGITLKNSFFAVVPVILGILMIILGLNTTGVVSLSRLKVMQKFNMKLAKVRGKVGHDKGPFILGLINGLMPCGPLQLMQIYALGTGSFEQGALAMFAFSIGTVPLMLGLGVFINKLSVTSKVLVFKMGGYLIILLGASMMINGLATVGINTSILSNKVNPLNSNEGGNIMEDGYQVVRVDVRSRSYGDIVVQKDIPVRLLMNVEPGQLTSCNYAVSMPNYDILTELQEGENIIEFNPTEEGTFTYSCWMGMIRNTITVV